MGSKNRFTIFLLMIVLGVVGVYRLYKYSTRPPHQEVTAIPDSSSGSSSVDIEERHKAYRTAYAAGAAEKNTWPKTPKELIFEFWEAASRKDYQRLTILCPGSTVDDYKIYEQWTPSPALAVGEPEPHPQKPDVSLYPVTIPFPGFPKKTIKTAIVKLEDGRLAIDGQNTIWW